jgi:antitoxin YefM
MPRALSYSQLRAELKAVLDEVCDTHDPVYVVRPRGANVVIVSREDYERMVETAQRPTSFANRQRLEEEP